MNYTKARHLKTLTVAHEAISEAGGVEAIDALDKDERKAKLKELKISVADKTGCHIDTAGRNVAKVMRGERHPLNDIDDRGGWRGGGRPSLPEGERRKPMGTRLAPGSQELAKGIAKVLKLQGWGRSVDQALTKWVEADPALREKLAEIGITVKANGGKGL